MKKIVLVPDSFKGSLTSAQACQALARACRRVLPAVEVVSLPVSDGGEGLVEALLLSCGGKSVRVKVNDPLMREIEAQYGVLPDGSAVIEMAAASGLTLLAAGERDPLVTSSYGTGELIADALRRGCKRILLGIGGSATCDGGAGMAAALGMPYLDSVGNTLLNGGDLLRFERIDTTNMPAALRQAQIRIACDVDNPLHGTNGAAHIYAPQKGASPAQVEVLDRGLRRLSDWITRETGLDMQRMPGSGAAGGLAVPLIACLGAKLSPGVDVVLDALDFERHLQGCDLVVTGEGRSDAQSGMGKLLSGVARRAKACGVPVVALSGALHAGYETLYEEGIDAFFSASREPGTVEDAMAHAGPNLERAAEDLFRLLRALEDAHPRKPS